MPEVTCTSCGAENPAGQKFCGACGHALEARALFERMGAKRWLERIDGVRPKETVAA